MTRIDVLDHGFVALHNMAGPVRRLDREFDADDRDPAMAARMSFDVTLDADRLPEQDHGLDAYLMRNAHTTPIEMVEVWLEMKLPIFIARQFVRHRTATINEVSARYVKLPAEWYIPDLRLVGMKGGSSKQGRVIDLDDEPAGYAFAFCDTLNRRCRRDYELYTVYLEAGVPAELARSFLHVNHYTHWIWKQDLHNLMHFMSLRLHSHAQYEARVYAQAIYDLLKPRLPVLMGLFDEYRRRREEA